MTWPGSCRRLSAQRREGGRRHLLCRGRHACPSSVKTPTGLRQAPRPCESRLSAPRPTLDPSRPENSCCFTDPRAAKAHHFRTRTTIWSDAGGWPTTFLVIMPKLRDILFGTARVRVSVPWC